MSTIALRDQVVPDTPQAERPLAPKPRVESKGRNLRAGLPFDRVALLLQGGGALGAYQAGVYEALAETGLHPDWVLGISIGAINAAIIAGNAPERRVDKLRGFWEEISAPATGFHAEVVSLFERGKVARAYANQVNAAMVASAGAPGFFRPRIPNPWFHPPGTIEATSYYTTRWLKATLERFVDFDRVNANKKETRVSLGAVNVRSGNLVYFDNVTQVLGPEHVMASGALPPALPAIEIEGEHYWDGGLVSNTPFQWLVTKHPRRGGSLAGRTRVPGRSLERARRLPAQHGGSHDPAEGDPILEPHPRLYRFREEAAQGGILRSRAPGTAAGGVQTKRGGQVSGLDGETPRLQSRAPHLSLDRLRRRLERLWVLPAVHGGPLAFGYSDTTRTLRHPEVLERTGNGKEFTIFDFAGDGD